MQNDAIKKHFQQFVPMFLQPIRTPAKIPTIRKLSPPIIPGHFYEDEKRLEQPLDTDEIPMFQLKPTIHNPPIQLTPNYQRINSRCESPRESQDISTNQDYFFGENTISPFKTVNRQLFRTNFGTENDEPANRKLF